ncbi:ATP-dependent DNA helicase pif1, partial [Fusarium oxysporum f. sp. albedinis]
IEGRDNIGMAPPGVMPCVVPLSLHPGLISRAMETLIHYHTPGFALTSFQPIRERYLGGYQSRYQFKRQRVISISIYINIDISR